jgi:hypothetical protein
MCGSSKARLRDIALEGLGEGVEEIGALFAQGLEVRADDAQGLSARQGAKAAPDLLLDLRHAHGLLGEVAGKGNPGISHKAQHIVGTGAQPVEQMTALLCRVRPRLPEGGARGLAASPSATISSRSIHTFGKLAPVELAAGATGL